MRSRPSETIAPAVGKHEGPQKIEKKRREFSKIMAVIAITMWVFVNLFGMAMVVFTLDTSPLMYVIPSVDAVVAAIIGFYLWKARAENQIKLRKLYGVDINTCVSPYDMPDYGTGPYTPIVTDVPLYENTNIV